MIWQEEGELTAFHLYFKLSSCTGSKSKLTSAARGGLCQYCTEGFKHLTLLHCTDLTAVFFYLSGEVQSQWKHQFDKAISLFSVVYHNVPIQDALALLVKALGNRFAECTRVSHQTADLAGDCLVWELWDVPCTSGHETYFCYQQGNTWIGWSWTQKVNLQLPEDR